MQAKFRFAQNGFASGIAPVIKSGRHVGLPSAVPNRFLLLEYHSQTDKKNLREMQVINPVRRRLKDEWLK